MGKKKCDNKELKKQVEQLENMIQDMKNQMKSSETTKEYKFNEEQMNEFVNSLYIKFNDWFVNLVNEYEFSEDCVSIEVDELVIVPTIESSSIADEISNNIIKPSDEELMDMVQETIDGMYLTDEENPIVYSFDEDDED
jgi:hypothetical protein